jgi:phosphoglucomutase
MESPIAAIESGRGGVCASATTAAAEPKPAAETEAAGTTVASSRASPRVSARDGLGVSDLPVAWSGTMVGEWPT